MSMSISNMTPMPESLQKIKDYLFDTIYKRSCGLKGSVPVFSNPLNKNGHGTIFIAFYEERVVNYHTTNYKFMIYGHVYDQNGYSLGDRDLPPSRISWDVDGHTFSTKCDAIVLGIYADIRKYWTENEGEMFKQLGEGR